ncbi:MAG: primosomal protein N' [Bacteroidota bacterium]|nr:primosomal protein N' [Bacteroidota bacterium]
MKQYAELIFPFPIDGSFTYHIIEGVEVGKRVVAQFGMKKIYTGIVIELHNRKPRKYQIKTILSVLDEYPIVNTTQITFWKWISSYYMCCLGDVVQTALPSAFKLASETMIQIIPSLATSSIIFTSEELSVVSVLEKKHSSTLSGLLKIFEKDTLFPIIDKLLNRGVILLTEELRYKYSQKTVNMVDFTNDGNIDISLFNKAPKQREFVSSFQNLKKSFTNKEWELTDVLKKTGISRSVAQALVNKNIIKISQKFSSRLEDIASESSLHPLYSLSKHQNNAFNKIEKAFTEKDICLLHGVTSSGKTEIYMHYMQKMLDEGKQVLYLLPEIALTTQIIKRIKKFFGNQVGVFHSRISNAKRVEVWKAVGNKDIDKPHYSIIIGARSALFLPFDNLGLIVIDEEHDTSYKQNTPNPKYNARDAAIYLAKLHKSKVLLGSATPSLESYFNTENGKYSLVNLNQRYGNVLLPEIQCVDIRKSYLKKEMVFNFSTVLIEHIRYALSEKKQVILFQNRRGYSPILSCSVCNFTPSCNTCDVSRTYHKGIDKLKCHYCGSTENIPKICPSCDNTEFSSRGFGTEQIEEQINNIFDDVVCCRMDYDTTRKQNSYQEIISGFESGDIDILIGTQMISKGLDFENVSLVGILNADNMLQFPDFRSNERAFQLMMQVSGRSGRKDTQGKVIIQTFDYNHHIFKFLLSNNYNSFYANQMAERKVFKYPPFRRLIVLILKGKKQHLLDSAANELSIIMRKKFPDSVLGPEYPAVSRIRNYYQKQILIKIDAMRISLSQSKEVIKSLIVKLKHKEVFRSIRVDIDIDPF